jgi:hypothetical protein
MANVQGLCSSFKREILCGLHAMGASVIRAGTTKDAFKAALYLASASHGVADTAYTATGEVSGTGYTAGGVAITNANDPSLSGTAAVWTPSASLVFGSTGSPVTLSVAFDAVMVYNDTSGGKLAVSVHTFGSQTVTAGVFTLTMPANVAGTALIQVG